jgi:hypothetical protein
MTASMQTQLADFAPEFIAATRGTALEECVLFWSQNCATDGLPRKDAIVMTRLPRKILPHVFLYEHTDEGRFRCRLAGTAITREFGQDPTRFHLDELIVPSSLESRQVLFRGVLQTRRPVVYGGRLANTEHQWKPFRRVLMPIADSAGKPCFVFGMVTFPKPIAGQFRETDEALEFQHWG